MIRTERWMDIRELQQQGVSQREIARQTGHARNTVARLLRQATPEAFKKPARASRLDPYKPYLKKRWEDYHLSARRLLEEIEAQGYVGCINLIQRYIKTVKAEQTAQTKATVRFETAPGKQAQADWAHVGEDEHGKIYAFIIVLGFSRTLFVDFTRSMDTENLIRCHEKAFAHFGGVPALILYDNMSQVKRIDGEKNALFADFAAHYGFAYKTHRVRRPRTKGKVERAVEYLKDNFLNGRTFAGFDDLAQQGKLWMEAANSRIHTTTGQRPIDLLEREGLAPLSAAPPYVIARCQERKVGAEGYVRLDRARYSVPPQYVGRRVIVVQKEQRVLVKLGDTIIADHTQGTPGACVADREHVAAMWKLTLEKSPEPASSTVRFAPAETVARTPLSVYEEVTQ